MTAIFEPYQTFRKSMTPGPIVSSRHLALAYTSMGEDIQQFATHTNSTYQQIFRVVTLRPMASDKIVFRRYALHLDHLTILQCVKKENAWDHHHNWKKTSKHLRGAHFFRKGSGGATSFSARGVQYSSRRYKAKRDLGKIPWEERGLRKSNNNIVKGLCQGQICLGNITWMR